MPCDRLLENMKKVVIRADDLGISPGVNQAIKEVCDAGMIKNVGIMINLENIENAVKDLPENIDLGLHCNISVGKPVSDEEQISSLVDSNGSFFRSDIYRRSENDFVKYEEVRKEIRSQVLRFEKIVGRLPDYMDIHAVSSFNFLKAVKDVSIEFSIPYIPLDLDQKGFVLDDKHIVMRMSDPETDLDSLFESNNEYGVIISHPGHTDEILKSRTGMVTMREFELKRFTDLSTLELIKDMHIELIRFTDLFC